MKTIKHQHGVTIFEVLIVTFIIGGILFLSIRQYQSLRMNADAFQVRATVDVILEAMGPYYKMNCNEQYGNPPKYGTLNPYNSSHPLSIPNGNFPINITNDLQKNGFLTITIPPNAIVDNSPSAPGLDGYVAQFNLNSTPRQYCTRPITPGVPITGITAAQNCDVTSLQVAGTIISWKAQVAVKLKDPTTASAYKNLLGADCVSNLVGTNVVTPCSSLSPSTGNYLVWQRNPSLGSMANGTGYWATNPLVTQFTQSYRSYPVEYLMGVQGVTPAGQQMQYFICGD